LSCKKKPRGLNSRASEDYVGLDPKNALKIAIPTLCIFYTLHWCRLRSPQVHREVFGNGEYYLDLSFEGNPNGFFQRAEGARRSQFRGVLATGSKQEAIIGTRVAAEEGPVYFFDSSLGHFHGRLKKVEKRCEPALHFRLSTPDAPQQGILTAGFCY
jgi:hypothetical protein